MGYTDASSSAALIHMEARVTRLFSQPGDSRNRPALAYLVSFTFWILSALFYAVSMYAWRRMVGDQRESFWQMLRLPLLNFLIVAITSPLFYYFAKGFSFQKENWLR